MNLDKYISLLNFDDQGNLRKFVKRYSRSVRPIVLIIRCQANTNIDKSIEILI